MTDRLIRMMTIVSVALPIGRAVRYYPVDCEPEFVTSVVTSLPWILGHGEIVIKIAGRSGCVAVNHLELVGVE